MHDDQHIKDRLIVALDMPTVEEARRLVTTLGSTVSFYKVGLELLFAGGLDLASDLRRAGKRVFLDMKLLDIGQHRRARPSPMPQSSASISSPSTAMI